MEPRSGTRGKIKPRCIVNYSTSRRPEIDAYAVHATWPRSVSGRSWSFSPINSVVPQSRWPLPQAVRDAERRTGEPGVALLAGVRGENSPHYTKRPPERKNSIKKMQDMRPPASLHG